MKNKICQIVRKSNNRKLETGEKWIHDCSRLVTEFYWISIGSVNFWILDIISIFKYLIGSF
jgi:hypothetical protein